MKLFENEVIIIESESKQVTLTNRRIRYTQNNTDVISIMLEKISSIEVTYRSWPILLLIGIIGIGYGALLLSDGREYESNQAILAIVGGAVFTFAYFLTRKHVISIAPDGGTKIHFTTRGMKNEMVQDFVNKIEEAKSNLNFKQ